MDLEDISIAAPPPFEGPIDIDDVIDSELSKTAKLEIEPTKDALFRGDELSRRTGRFSVRQYLIAAVCVSFGLLVLIIAISLSVSSNRSSISKKTGDERAEDVARSFICLATQSSCPANATKDWTQVSHDIIGDKAEDLAGSSVAMSCDGSIMAVGAPTNTVDAGTVRVYELQANGGWSVLGTAIVGLNSKDQAGTAVALSGDGKRIAVGAASNDDSGENAGHVRVFDFKRSGWDQIGQDIQGEGAGDRTGRSISLSLDGTRLAIGGERNNATGIEAGHVRVYRMHHNDDRWKQLGQDLDGANMGDFFGKSVALSGDGNIVAVGGHKSDGGNLFTDAGHVRVYHYNEDARTWLQLGNEIKGPAAGSWFGWTVSLSTDGHILAVGAPGDSGFLPGYTFVYKLENGVTWSRMGNKVWGGHGVDLSYSGKRLISSSPQGKDNGIQSGTAIVFEYNGTQWNQVGGNMTGLGPGEMAGAAVAISGDGMRVASSAPTTAFFNLTKVGFVRAYDYCVRN